MLGKQHKAEASKPKTLAQTSGQGSTAEWRVHEERLLGRKTDGMTHAHEGREKGGMSSVPWLGEGPRTATHFSSTAWRSATTLGSVERPKPWRKRSLSCALAAPAAEELPGASQASACPAAVTMKPARRSRMLTLVA